MGSLTHHAKHNLFKTQQHVHKVTTMHNETHTHTLMQRFGELLHGVIVRSIVGDMIALLLHWDLP